MWVPLIVRSQSVGPVEVTEKRSPKRQSRSATVKEKKTASTNTSSTRRPRPCMYDYGIKEVCAKYRVDGFAQ